MPSQYTYDVFISYKRDPVQDEWLHDHFVPLFASAVRQEIAAACNREPEKIFFDQVELTKEKRVFDLNGIDPGQQWRDALQLALKTSRCLVALWSPLYFFSGWCKAEWETFKKRSPQVSRDLVVGISVYDGNNFPPDAQAIQLMDFADFNIIGAGYKTTPLYVTFQQEVKKLALHVAQVVSKAPDFDDNWPVVDVTPPTNPPAPDIPQMRL
jgi:hypothetical protein